MERAKKLKAEREAREKATREAREKAAKEKAAREKAAKEAAKKTRSAVKDLHKGHSTGDNTGGNQPVKTPSGKPQGLMTAAQRDAEEKSYYESPIKTMHQAEKDDAGRYADTGTGGYEAVADYAKDIAWREKLDEMVYEDRKSGWTPGGEVIGAGYRDYTEGVVSKWNKFTGGQYPLKDLTGFDSVKVYENNKDIKPIDVILAKEVPGAVAGATIGLPFAMLGPAAGFLGAGAAGLAGNKIGEALNPSLISEGPMESMELVGRSDDQNMTVIITAKKYNEGGMDVQTTYSFDGVAEPVDSFKKECMNERRMQT
jgi:hypothetical protein